MSLAALVSACAAPTSPTQAPAARSTAATTLLVWHGWSGLALQALGQLAERFNRQSTIGRVILQSIPLAGFGGELRAAAQAGSGPHLAIIPHTWAGGLAADGVLLRIDDQISGGDRADLIPATLGGAEVVGIDGIRQLVGLPISFDTLALIYNQANILTPPSDTAALLASARGLSAPDAKPPVWGLAVNLSLDMMIGYLYAFDSQIFDEQGQIVLGSAGRAGAERWLAWVQSLSADRQLFARASSSIMVEQELRSGRALATFDWSYQYPVYRSLWGERAAVSALPRLTETGLLPKPHVRSDLLTINARATGQERDAALAFLRYLGAEEAQLALFRANLQPARAIALPQDDPRAQAALTFRAQAEQGLPMSNGVERSVIDQELRLMLQQVLSGLTSPADAVADTDRRLRERLSP